MSKIKILIVEDETIVALDIKSAIQKLGHEVTKSVTNYDEAIESVVENEPNIILMDINLKNSLDGIEASKAIQKIKNIPIIYLTAFSDDETISRAVQTNPVGYLIKPFKREELKSTILLGLYKINANDQEHVNDEYIHIGFNYYYDLQNRNLYFNNQPLRLSIKEKLLLEMLIDARGNIIPFNTIEYTLWPDGPISDSTLRTLVYRLRTKLDHKLIETIPSVGCKLVLSS